MIHHAAIPMPYPRAPGPLPAGDEIQVLLRAFGVSATLIPADNGVVLEGISPTYYGKQMAQEIARKANLVVSANRIRVRRGQQPGG